MVLRKPPILRALLAVLHQGGTRCDLICLTECELHHHRQLAWVEEPQRSDVPTLGADPVSIRCHLIDIRTEDLRPSARIGAACSVLYSGRRLSGMLCQVEQ
jgi:hypothetical protein